MLQLFFFFFQAEDGIRDDLVTGVQTCALPISPQSHGLERRRGRGHRAGAGRTWRRLMATTTRTGTGTREEYLQLHRWMCMAKALDDRMHILVKQGRAPFVGSSRGHEGIQVASTAAPGPEDSRGPAHR